MTAYSNQHAVVDFNHWWASKGELAAVNEIKKAVVKRGGKFEETNIVGYDNFRIGVIERFNLGYPPSVVQWLGGKELQQFKDQGMLLPLPKLVGDKKIEDVLFDDVISELSADGDISMLPVGIHIQNIVYYNAKIFNELKLTPPSTWKQFLQQAKTIKKAGYTPIAVNSTDKWQLSMLLDSLLLTHGGEKLYQEIFFQKKPINKWRDALILVLNDLLKLKEFTDSKHNEFKWDKNVEAMAYGEAAIQFMGDFATGELNSMGLKAGEDYYCSLSPDNNNIIYYVLDVFALLKGNDEELVRGQELMVETILDPEVQAAYNSKKGGLPVRSDLKVENLEGCASDLYRKWTSQDYTHLPVLAANSRTKLSVILDVKHSLWKSEEPNVEAGVDKIINLINKLNE